MEIELKKPEVADKKRPLYVAFDIEKKGSSLAHEILQIGVAWSGGLDMHVSAASFCFKDTGPWEQRCYDEFWKKQLPNLDRIRAEAVDAKGGWASFKDLLDMFEEECDDVHIVSDNPAYDLTHIDHNLIKQTGRLFGVRFTTAGGYRWVHDPSEVMKGLPLGVRRRIKKKIAKECPHTHWAVDDAKSILTQHFLVQAAVTISDEAEKKWNALFETKPKEETATPLIVVPAV